MNWHSFLDLSTMPHRHLLFSYITVIVIQGGYFSWIAWNWRNPKAPRH
jgi:hypothetical protein